MKELILPFFNFTILVGFLIYKGRKPVADFVRDRHHQIAQQTQQASQGRADADAKNQDAEAKLVGYDAERSALQAQLSVDAAAMKSRVLAEAQKLSARIVSDARLTVDAMTKELKAELKTELALTVVARAESLLKERLTQSDRIRMTEEFSAQMGASK